MEDTRLTAILTPDRETCGRGFCGKRLSRYHHGAHSVPKWCPAFGPATEWPAYYWVFFSIAWTLIQNKIK